MLVSALAVAGALWPPGAVTLEDPELGSIEVAWRCDEERSGRCFIGGDGSKTVVVWYRSSAPGLQLWAEVLLAPFDDMLARAEAVEVFAAGESAQVDVHALIWRGRPLVVGKPVAYAMDLIATDAPSRSNSGMLILADPRGGLREARREAAAVLNAWQRIGISGRLVADRLDRTELLDSLAASFAFQFIGHGERGAYVADSDDLWDTELQLADGSSLGVDDVLATLTTAPRVVILSACETGLVDARALGGGFAVAHAFLSRGSAAVIATTRPVDDGAAARLMQAFYAPVKAPVDLLDPALLSRAQATMLAGESCDERPDVCAYRAWIP